MAFYTINALIIHLIILMTTLHTVFGKPSHIRHRIHVPTKVKTVYHTKIIKVPEHHHYFHEKEKPHLVKVPEHHHYFHEEKKQTKKHELPTWKKPALDLYDNHDNYDSIKDDDSYEHDFDSYASYNNHNYNYEPQEETQVDQPRDHHKEERRNNSLKKKKRAPPRNFYRKHRRSRA